MRASDENPPPRTERGGENGYLAASHGVSRWILTRGILPCLPKFCWLTHWVFSPQDRRRIEAEAFSGNLLGIVATNALELGVDIGSLDAVLVHGFPPTVASFVRVFPSSALSIHN